MSLTLSVKLFKIFAWLAARFQPKKFFGGPSLPLTYMTVYPFGINPFGIIWP